MKINLECGKDIRNGYVNTNANPALFVGVPEGVNFTVSGYENIDHIAKNGTVDEIIFGPPLNKLNPRTSIGVITGWKEKLKINGIIKFGFYDIRTIGLYAHRGSASLVDLHNTIFGQQNEYRSIMDTDLVINVIKSIGLRMDVISINEHIVNIEATNVQN